MGTLFPFWRGTFVHSDCRCFLLVETLAVHLTASNLSRPCQQAKHAIGGGVCTSRVRKELFELIYEIWGPFEEGRHLMKYLECNVLVSIVNFWEALMPTSW